jgi:short-subunit dehydrogenase
MTEQGGSYAVVTGASSGIGLELARVLAEEGYDLLITAEEDAIRDAAGQLRAQGANVEVVQADLSARAGVEQLYAAIEGSGRPVDVLCVNAGIGSAGDFARDTDLDQELELVDLNCRSTVHLTKLVVRDMVARDAGRILFTSSVASAMAGGYMAVYNASKSFVQSFALALRAELDDTDVSVTSLMPGPTETEFFERADMLDTKIAAGDKDDPAEVARQGYDALMAGKEQVVAGSLMNRVQVAAARVLPDRVKAELNKSQAKPGSGDD